MIKFRTEYKSEPSLELLTPDQKILLMGSCFTDSIGERMRECGIDAISNPTGVLYNPASIAKIMELALRYPEIREEIDNSIIEREGVWRSWFADSSIVGETAEAEAGNMLQKLDDLRSMIEKVNVMIITFGTSWIYELSDTNNYIVANCHKFPANKFIRCRLAIDEIVDRWNGVIEKIRKFNPGIRFIFTVSPIRHLKDGFEGNNRSKAVLSLACERLEEVVPNVDYFPAYEILTDDLRDYRFYASDLVHPSPMAVEYIWEKFCDTYYNSESQNELKRRWREHRAQHHRPNIIL